MKKKIKNHSNDEKIFYAQFFGSSNCPKYFTRDLNNFSSLENTPEIHY